MRPTFALSAVMVEVREPDRKVRTNIEALTVPNYGHLGVVWSIHKILLNALLIMPRTFRSEAKEECSTHSGE